MNSPLVQTIKKELYTREFHTIKDRDTNIAYDIENVRLVKLNHLELRILEQIKTKPLTISDLKKNLSYEKSEMLEQAVKELVEVDMLGYSSYKNTSQGQIDEFETNTLKKWEKKKIIQMALNVTHKCNFNCDYCYGEDGSYGGPAVNMNKKTAKQAVDFLINAAGNSDICRITFFGGEPLLNFDLIKYVIQYSRKEASKQNKKMLFGIATNGVLMDEEKMDLFIKENVELTFSFDGPKKIQDKNRVLKSNGKNSSYDIVYPNLLKYSEKAKKNKKFYAFRATITRTGLKNINEVVNFFKKFKTKEIHYDFAEYKNCISQGGLAITDDDLELFRQNLKEMAKKFIKNGPEGEYDFFSGALTSIKEKKKISNSCTSPGITYIGVSAEGDIFPCHRFVGYKETKLGNVWNGFNRELWLKKFTKVHIFNSKTCSKCWIRFFCGGLCPATSYFLGEDMALSETINPEPVHCKIRKILYEEAILVAAKIYNNSKSKE